jgi:hypothetical protein
MIKNLNIKSKIKDKKYSLQFLPKCLESTTQQTTVIFNGKKLKPAYIIDIVHNLVLRYYFKKENLFNLSSLILKEKYGYLYKHYMEFLVHKEVLIVHKDYAVGKNARVYKLSHDIINNEILRYKNNDIVLLKKYKKAVSAIDTEDIKTNSILPEIKHKIVSDLFTANVNYEKAIFYLDNTIQDADCYNKNKYSVQSIADKHIFYHFDTYGRVHTNFTILKSFIRKNCLLINGQETAEIDISNSQPLFLSKLINEEGFNLNEHEVNVFNYLVYHGKFYQFLMDNSEIKDKKQCKELVYITLFGRNSSKIKNSFAVIFPSIYNFIVDYKNTYGDYRLLAHKLQNEESNFIFNKLIKNIYIINPKINVITIHDSIIVEKQYESQIQNLMDSMLSSEFHFIDKDYIF